MKGDGVLNLLIFQAFQDVRMASSLVRSTIQTLGIPRAFAFFGVIGFGWIKTGLTYFFLHMIQ